MLPRLVAFVVTLIAATCVSALPNEHRLPVLPKAVRDDLLSRDPSEYEVFHNEGQLNFANISTQTLQGMLEKRAQQNGLISTCKSAACMSLTFDDGPYNYHKELDDLLAKYSIVATFAVNGYNWDCIYDPKQVVHVRDSLKAGHQIMGHTWNHVHIPSQTNAQLDQQIELLETALYKIAGIVPAFLRPPYGEITQKQVEYLNSRGLVVVTWTSDSLDSDGASVAQSMDVYRKLKAPSHEIVLNHETYASTVQQLMPQAIPQLLGAGGYKKKDFVTVADGLGLSPYKVKAKPGKRDKTWTCDGTPAPGSD